MRVIQTFLLIGLLGLASQLWAQRTYKSESVLSSGEWYKIGIIDRGVYRLDPGFFREIGLNPDAIDPRNIRIYGNASGLLPQANASFRHDDLVENAIYVEGEGDGNFSGADHVLFYAEAAHVWDYEESRDRFRHRQHFYTDTSYYFLTIADSPGKRISALPEVSHTNLTATRTRGMLFHEEEKESPISSGRYWLGERFDAVTEYSFNFEVPDLDPDGSVRLYTRLAGRSDRVTSFRIKANGQFVGNPFSIRSTNLFNDEVSRYIFREGGISFPASLVAGETLEITIEYNKAGSSDSRGWLDFLEIEYDQRPNTSDRDQFFMSLTEGIGVDQVAKLEIQNASDAYRVWDISDPLNVQQVPVRMQADARMELAVPTESLVDLIAFRGGFLSPITTERIPNQNLHGLPLSEYIIVAPEAFRAEAERLGQFHLEHDGFSYVVVSPEQLYNEFSGGLRDITAIRDLAKMMYDQSAGQLPTHLLMFGDGSFDQKGILRDINGNPTSLAPLPTYQSRNSWNPVSSFTTDDFLVMLEDNEGFWAEGARIDGDNVRDTHTLDAGVGRLPIEDIAQAKQIVDKIITYATDTSSLGDWRSRIVLVADHKQGEGSIHVQQADGYTRIINEFSPCMNLEKIYMDNYPFVPTPTRPSFPEGRRALLTEMDRGSLLLNYTGHGGETAWSNAQILQNADVARINNGLQIPAVITATCEFGRFDNPTLRSGAELMVMREGGGAIALFTTVRLVYSSPNETLNANLYREMFKFNEEKGRMPTMGEIFMFTKNRTFKINGLTNINSRNFTLLGDPALTLNYPRLRAEITEINGEPIQSARPDTLPSLSQVTITGRVMDLQGRPIEDYEGTSEITVFDKPSRFTTRLSNFSFFWRKNRIFTGRSSVKDGEFNIDFVVPLDVSYDEGVGKISLYLSNLESDAAGCYTNFFVGGTAENVERDDQGPEISLYMNDASWKDGGITGRDPNLFALLKDENGINTVGSGIGHEIVAFLDDDEANPIILNDFYRAEKDSYTQGSVEFRLKELELGPHSLRIRAWDVANNPAEAITTFIVSDDARMALDQILAVPNPLVVGQNSAFWIGHNQAGKELQAEIEIYSMTGRLVKVLQARFLSSGFNYQGLSWDGTTDNGNPLTPGVYNYQVKLKDMSTGDEVRSFERIVLLRQ